MKSNKGKMKTIAIDPINIDGAMIAADIIGRCSDHAFIILFAVCMRGRGRVS